MLAWVHPFREVSSANFRTPRVQLGIGLPTPHHCTPSFDGPDGLLATLKAVVEQYTDQRGILAPAYQALANLTLNSSCRCVAEVANLAKLVQYTKCLCLFFFNSVD